MSAMIHVVHGPNLNLLGRREVGIYGHGTLANLEQRLQEIAASTPDTNIPLNFFQSNHEGVLIDYVHKIFAAQNCCGLIVNLGAYSHTSLALRDAFQCLVSENCPLIEVHISNVYQREKVRHYSYLSDIAQGMICGLGTYGYEAALTTLIKMHHERTQNDHTAPQSQ